MYKLFASHTFWEQQPKYRLLRTVEPTIVTRWHFLKTFANTVAVKAYIQTFLCSKLSKLGRCHDCGCLTLCVTNLSTATIQTIVKVSFCIPWTWRQFSAQRVNQKEGQCLSRCSCCNWVWKTAGVATNIPLIPKEIRMRLASGIKVTPIGTQLNSLNIESYVNVGIDFRNLLMKVFFKNVKGAAMLFRISGVWRITRLPR